MAVKNQEMQYREGPEESAPAETTPEVQPCDDVDQGVACSSTTAEEICSMDPAFEELCYSFQQLTTSNSELGPDQIFGNRKRSRPFAMEIDYSDDEPPVKKYRFNEDNEGIPNRFKISYHFNENENEHSSGPINTLPTIEIIPSTSCSNTSSGPINTLPTTEIIASTSTSTPNFNKKTKNSNEQISKGKSLTRTPHGCRPALQNVTNQYASIKSEQGRHAFRSKINEELDKCEKKLKQEKEKKEKKKKQTIKKKSNTKKPHNRDP